jgi:hypothetical protein
MITNEQAYEMGKQAGCRTYKVKRKPSHKQAALEKAAFMGRLAALTAPGGGGGMYGTGGGAADKQFQSLYGMPVADFRKQMQARNQLVNAMSMNQMFSLPAMMRGGFGGGGMLQPNYGGGFQRTAF